jgi:hypothetical protein
MEPEIDPPVPAPLVGREKLLLQMATLANAHVMALEAALTQLMLDLNVAGFSAGRISGDGGGGARGAVVSNQ